MSSLKGTYSFSGSDTRVYAYFNKDKIVRLETMHTLSLSVYEAKGRVRSLGFKTVRGFTRAVREIAGTMIMLVTNDHPLADLMKANDVYDSNLYGNKSVSSWSFDAETTALGAKWKIDPLENFRRNDKMRAPGTLPPFNILLEYVTEIPMIDENGKPTGEPLHRAAMEIIDVEILGEGIVSSVNDLVTEVQYQFLARDFRELSSGEVNAAEPIDQVDLSPSDSVVIASYTTRPSNNYAKRLLGILNGIGEWRIENIVKTLGGIFENNDSTPVAQSNPTNLPPVKNDVSIAPLVTENDVNTLQVEAEATAERASEANSKALAHEEKRAAFQAKADAQTQAMQDLIADNPGFDPNDPNADPALLNQYSNIKSGRDNYQNSADQQKMFKDNASKKAVEDTTAANTQSEAASQAQDILDKQKVSDSVRGDAAPIEEPSPGTIVVSGSETLSSMKEFETLTSNGGKTREFSFSDEKTRWASTSDMTGTPIQVDFADEVNSIETTNLRINGSGQNVYIALDSQNKPIAPPTVVPGSTNTADAVVTVDGIVNGTGQNKVISVDGGFVSDGGIGKFKYSDNAELIGTASFANENKELIAKTQTGYPMLGESGEDRRIALQAETYSDYVQALGDSNPVLKNESQFDDLKKGRGDYYYPSLDVLSEREIKVQTNNNENYSIKQEVVVLTSPDPRTDNTYSVFIRNSMKKDGDSSYTKISTAAQTTLKTTMLGNEPDTYTFDSLLQRYNELAAESITD